MTSSADEDGSCRMPELVVLGEMPWCVVVCSSLGKEEVTKRVNARYGHAGKWRVPSAPLFAPGRCAEKPQTHRHFTFERY